jgi:hypothetical protein
MKPIHYLSYLLFFLLSIGELSATTGKFRLILRDNPSTSVVVAWDQVNGSNPVVYYDTIDHGSNFAAYAFTHGVDRTTTAKGMNNTFSRLTGLQPNKVYYFLVKDDNSQSPRYSFKTIPDVPSERLSIIAGGDSRNNRTPRQNANKLVARLRAHAVLFGGDMTDLDTDGQWSDWFDDWMFTIATDGRMTPIIPARGNHEYNSSVIYDLFDVPVADAYFANSFGGNLFRSYTLNSNIATGGSQATWLQNDLQANSNVIWKAAQYHHPIRPHVGSKSERNDIYSNWVPKFEQFGVNFVVECDAHTVKSTYPVLSSTASGNVEGFVRDDVNGIVYVGEGCWGAPLRANDDSKSWTRSGASFNQFKLIFIDMNRIEIRTIRTDNAASVGYNTDADIFAFPTNLDIWNPAEGDVVIIENYSQAGRPDVSLVNPLANQIYTNLNSIPLIALSTDTDGGTVDSVQFFVNETYVGTATSTTTAFRVDWTPPTNGVYSIYAKAFDDDMKLNRTQSLHITVYSNNTVLETTVTQSSDDAEEYANGTLNISSTDLEMVDDTDQNFLNQKIAIRFSNLGIPQGATILNAYIQFETDEVSTAATSLNIQIQDDANPATFGGASNISNRTLIANTINWSPPAWNNIGQASADQLTPNLAGLVQQVVNKAGWSPGNALAFIISGSGQRIAGSYDGGAAPKLIVEYSLTGNNFPGNVMSQINSSDDDAEESIFGTTSTSSSDLDIVFEGGNQDIGLRFTNITIPANATIESAYIQFYTIDVTTGSANLNIKIQDDLNPESFDAISLQNISSRPTMAPTVNWTPPGWNTIGQADLAQRTPNLASLVQPMVNKTGWQSGNPMAFIITGSGERDAVAYDTDPEQAAKLIINYSINIPPISSPNLADLTLCDGESATVDPGPSYAAYYWGNDVSNGQAQTFSVSNAGTYTLRVKDIYGQVAYDTFNVVVNPSPQPDLGGNQTYLGNPITLTVAGGPFSSYSWNTGETTSSITANAVGIYSLTVTNSFGCQGTDVILLTPPSNVQTLESFNFQAFPNPTEDFLQLRIKQPTDKEVRLQVTNALGQVCMRQNLRSGTHQWTIPVNRLDNGQYWFQLYFDDQPTKPQAVVIRR